MDIEPFGLKGSKAVGDDLKALPDGIEMIESLLESEVAQIVRAEFVAQEQGKLLVLFEEGVFAVGAENMVAVFDALQNSVEFAARPFAQAYPEDFGDLLGRHAPQPHFAGAFENFPDREVTLKNEIATVFDLGKSIKPAQIHLSAFAPGELGTEHKGPILQALADDLRAEAIRGSLEKFWVFDCEECVIVLAERDFEPLKFSFDKGMAVEVIGSLKREEGTDTQDHRTQDFVADVKVIMGEAAALWRQDPMVGILGGELRHCGTKSRPLFHAFKDEINPITVRPFHASQDGSNIVLFADSLFSPFDRNRMIECKGFHPVLVIRGPLTKHVLIDHADAEHVAKKVDHLFGTREAAEISMDDDPIKTVIYKDEQITKDFRESLHCLTSADDDVQARIAKKMAWPWSKRGPHKRWVEGKTFRLADEVRYIQRRAANHNSCIVTIGQLLLFSSETGDAWLLDAGDHLAAPLAKNGEPLSVDIDESDSSFSVNWMGSFSIEGEAFIYRPKKSRNVRTILGYPIRQVKDQISNMFG